MSADPMEPQDALYIFAIYRDPTDYPGKFVVRRWRVLASKQEPEDGCYVCSTLEGARHYVRARGPGMVPLQRAEGDDRAIYETWI